MSCPYVDHECYTHAQCNCCKRVMCPECVHCFTDFDVAYEECLAITELTDAEYEEYIEHGYVSNCSCFVQRGDDLW